MTTAIGSLLRRTRVVSIIKSRVFIATTSVCTGTLIAAGIAYASIPDSHGVVHACYKPTATAPKLPGKIRVIDSPSKSCVSGETPLNWDQHGVVAWAHINQAGTLVDGTHVTGIVHPAAGKYGLEFDRAINHCSVTSGTWFPDFNGFFPTSAGNIAVLTNFNTTDAQNLAVQTFIDSGNGPIFFDINFNLQLACP